MTPADPGRVVAADRRGISALVRELFESGVDLAHNAARMAASEGRVVVERLAVRLGLLVAGLLVAAVGLLLVLAGAARVVAQVSGCEPWVAFVAVGGVTLAAGAGFAVRALRRFGRPDLAFPATLAELTADVEALRGAARGAGEEPR